jgi:hypothetical protein
VGIPEETFQYELSHSTKLNNKHRGELAELAFMRKAAALGFSVAKPWGESERYDVVLRAGKVFWRVQVKSVRSKSPSRKHYRVTTTNWLRLPYTADEIDFLVAYIFPEDTWYVLPVSAVENRKALCISPKCKRSKLEKYREAWKLLQPVCVDPAPPDSATPGDSRDLPAT